MDRSLDLLVVDNDSEYAELIAANLQQEDDRFDVTAIKSAEDGFEQLSKQNFDAIISDYEMPEMNGIEFLEAVREHNTNIPFILFTQKGIEEVASDAIAAGMTDYFQKQGKTENYALLANRVSNAIEAARGYKREDQELQRTWNRLDRLTETIKNGLFVVTADYQDVLFVNEAAADIYGVTESRLNDEPPAWLDHVHPADRATLEESIERQREGTVKWPATQEFRIQHPSQGLRWVLAMVQPITDGSGEITEIAGVVTDITEQKQREKTTRETNIVLETIIESMPFGILVEDSDREVLAINEQLGDILGAPLNPDELRGRDCKAAAAELKNLFADPARFISILSERMAERELVRNEVIELADGRVLERDYVPYTLPDGEANLWLYQDITARKQRERELSNRIEAMDASIDGMAIVDDNDEFVYVNEAHAEVYGYNSGEAFIGETWKMCYKEATLGRFEEEIIPSLNSQGSWRGEATGRDKDGNTFPQELSLTLTDGDEIICVVRDISDRKEYQDTLEQLHGATRELMTASATEEVVTLASETATQILGQPRNRIHLYDAKAGKLVPAAWTADIEELLENDPSSLPVETGAAGRAYQTGEPQRWTTSYEGDESGSAGTPFETEYIVPLGDHGVFVLSSPEPSAFSPSDKALAEVFSANITAALDRVERQEQLQHERDRLDDFAGMLSHDIRNPLNVAMGRLEVVQAEYESEQFAVIERAHSRIETLIEDVLALARQGKQVDAPVPVELPTIVDNCWRNVETTEATLVNKVDSRIQADPERLTQLIENLLRNAIDHGGDDVTITIGDLHTKNGFYVADDGPGVAEDERERVFEAGYSTADDGTGLGLNIVRQIVEAHGWHASISESEGGGVRVEVSGVIEVSAD